MTHRLSLGCLVLGMLCLAACSSKGPAGSVSAPSANVGKPPAVAAAPQAAGSPVKKPGTAAAKESKTVVFRDEPAAHALYNQMIAALRKANSLSFVSHFQDEYKRKVTNSTYRVWLKKPNYFRVEAESTGNKTKGILIGDGKTLWIYWPEGRPKFWIEEDAAYQKTRLNSYMKKPAPPACHSIWHEMPLLGTGLPILELSTFHGYTDCMQEYIDGVKGLPAEKVDAEPCDGIEVSIMKHQRSWYLWLCRRDHLPRKLEEIVRLGNDIVVRERWSSVVVNGEIANRMFAWKPPKDWKQWRLPRPEERLLKPGAKAPDFQLASADGKRIKLSDYRGQVVWFYIWRAG